MSAEQKIRQCQTLLTTRYMEWRQGDDPDGFEFDNGRLRYVVQPEDGLADVYVLHGALGTLDVPPQYESDGDQLYPILETAETPAERSTFWLLVGLVAAYLLFRALTLLAR